MRDRLIELIQNAVGGCAEYWAKTIADHLIANGVIVPPCKVGDVVYQTDGVRIYELEVLDYFYHQNSLLCETVDIDFDETAIGKTVFLNREDAERALKEMNNAD